MNKQIKGYHGTCFFRNFIVSNKYSYIRVFSIDFQKFSFNTILSITGVVFFFWLVSGLYCSLMIIILIVMYKMRALSYVGPYDMTLRIPPYNHSNI
jgi:hypothetical protein